MSPQIWWHLSRASGIVAWLMLTGSVLLGIVLASDLFPRWRNHQWLLILHRWLASLTVVFLVTHVVTLLGDRYLQFGALDFLVPFRSSWRPTAIAAGVVALWLLAAVMLTALLVRKLGGRVWRDLHLAGYWVFWAASIHAALAGTDTSRLLYEVTSIAALTAILFATSYRVLSRHLPRRRRTPVKGNRGQGGTAVSAE